MKMAHVWLIEIRWQGKQGWHFVPEEMFKTRRVARIIEREYQEREYQDSAKGGWHYRVAKYVRVGRSEGKLETEWEWEP